MTVLGILVGLAFAGPAASALAQVPPDAQSSPVDADVPGDSADGDPASAAGQDAAAPADERVSRPTELGLRFTPGMARALAGKMSDGMVRRYELTDEQRDKVRDVLSTQMMLLAHDSGADGRDAIEFMMEHMIENDGSFTQDSAVEFARKLKPVMPRLERFMQGTLKGVTRQLNLNQRMRFTVDAAAATAGYKMFEARMQRWENGQVGKFANPFMDSGDREAGPDGRATAEAAAAAEAEDSRTPQAARARRRADRRVAWEIDRADEEWGRYVDQAITYYELDESQQNAARAILKECREKAGKIRTAGWMEKVKLNRVQQSLGYELGAELSAGPWMFRLDQEYATLTKPLSDISDDLKRRIDALPTTPQRAAALKKAQERYAQHGLSVRTP